MTSLVSVIGDEVNLVPIKRALLSVSDKTGLLELAKILQNKYSVELLSTGGTAKTLRGAGLNVIDVSDYTQSPEILDGRVKTLHPKIHGGLLNVRGNSQHEKEIQDNGIKNIDLVVMNLYPFDATVASGRDFATCIENIDIGGPSMLRSAAKNHKYVAVLTSSGQYQGFLDELQVTEDKKQCCTTLEKRKLLAAQAFATSAAYDANISTYFANQIGSEKMPTDTTVTRCYRPQAVLKYGCNPHQKPAALLSSISSENLPFTVINGIPGYINLLDACLAWQLVRELREALSVPAAASFKHCSPAGAAVGSVPLNFEEAAAYEISNPSALSPTALAYVRARNADPMCSFGDFAAVSHTVDVCTASIFKTAVCDGIIAPAFEPEALEILRAKKKGTFIILQADLEYVPPSIEFRELFGVVFSQRRNDSIFSKKHLQNIVVSRDKTALSEDAERDLILASIAVKFTQSNSVGYAIRGQMIGVGAGQQSRVDCVKLAGRKVSTWYLRQHPKVQGLHFKTGVKRQDRINARVRYIEGDITAAERRNWLENFEHEPSALTETEKTDFLESLSGVSISSDAFFPFRDSIDHASKYGVEFIAQPGGSIADQEVKDACKEYGMTMVFTELRLFLH